ncbi:MAG TPA: MaoC family dehydratase [Candidatus Macondimonas sp.]|nr:MaoC family dehydratase [Candidatus Macondimonas sp.]
MVKRVINGVAEMKELVGQEVGVSDWVEVTQERIDQFAKATGDDQWIHTDVERCRRESPHGMTIAHGYLTIALTPALVDEVIQIKGMRMGVNYGMNKLRFTAPVPVGSRIRVRVTLKGVREIAGAIQTVTHLSVEREGQDKPCCVAETLSLYYP